MGAYRTVVVGTDGSDTSLRAVAGPPVEVLAVVRRSEVDVLVVRTTV